VKFKAILITKIKKFKSGQKYANKPILKKYNFLLSSHISMYTHKVHTTRLYRKSMHLKFQPIHFKNHKEWETAKQKRKLSKKNEIKRLPKLKSQVYVSVVLEILMSITQNILRCEEKKFLSFYI